MARTIKVPAHTRKNGVKVKAYSYTVGGKTAKTAKGKANRKTHILNRDTGRYKKRPGNGPKRKISRRSAPRLRLTTEGGTGSIRTKR